MNAVELTDLTKHYGDFTLDRVSLSLPEGCVMGLVGENGAGKTTVIKLLLGMLKRDGGAVRVLGRDMDTDGRAIKEELGVVLDETGFPECVTARQAGRIMAAAYRNWDARAYDELLQAGYVYAVAGKGYFVAPRNMELLREENLRRIEAHLTEVAKLAASCDLTREDVINIYDVLSGEDESC